MPNLIRRFLVGQPLPTHEASERRLGKFSALAVFASDALSSIAYATEEILIILILAGSGALHFTIPIALAITLLLFIVMLSYRQTIFAYPTGGGAYTVAKENLGTLPSLIAGGSLLIDYVLTVSVSVAAGIAAITSAVPFLYNHRVILSIWAVVIVAVGNLRGLRESARMFSIPAYAFMGAMGTLIIGGLWHYVTGTDPSVSDVPAAAETARKFAPVTTFLLLRAFSSGCAALTGVEAISNGVTAFERPESENAARVLRWLAMILAVVFLGISFLAWFYKITPKTEETVVSQLATEIFGRGVLYYFVQAATCAILVLAANTSFNGFPRLASLMARDSYLPRQLQNLGDRLVFSNAILLLAAAACALLFLFQAETHRLIPLYAVGVFLSFTLSQSAMVVHHWRTREPAWRPHLLINLTGAVTTFVVLTAIIVTKFTHGAWIVALVLPMLILWFYEVRDHYHAAANQLGTDIAIPVRKLKHTVILPVAGIHKGVVAALEYARSLSPNLHAVTVALDETSAEKFRLQWHRWVPDIPLTVLPSPYRSLTEPLIKFIREVDARDPEDLITVVIPSFVPAKWWHNFLHNQSTFLLHTALRGMRNVVVTTVRVHLDE